MRCSEGRTITIFRSVAIVVVVTLFLASVRQAASQSSASYEITRSVISAGAGWSTSSSYQLMGIMGQPSPVGGSESESYTLGSGFWGTGRLFWVAIKSISYSVAQGVTITWQSIADATYIVYFTNSLSDIWQAVYTLPGTGGLIQWLDDGTLTGTHPGQPALPRRFYRLEGEP